MNYRYRAREDSLIGVHLRTAGEEFDWEVPPEQVGPNLEYLPPDTPALKTPAPRPRATE